MKRARGTALLLVLWLVMLLVGVLVVFAATARTEGLEGRTLARQAALRALAEGGIEEAVLRLSASDPARIWHADGRPNTFEYEGATITVRVVDESGKVDLNTAQPDLLEPLVVAVGGDPVRAPAIAAAIVDFRDPDSLLSPGGGAEDSDYVAAGLPYGAKDRAFESTTELQLVLGVDAALYAKLAPYVTVYTGQARPDPTFAGEPVLEALGLSPIEQQALLSHREPRPPGVADPELAAPGTGTYSISSRATRPDGTQVDVHATVRLGAGGGLGQLYTPLAWRVGDPD